MPQQILPIYIEGETSINEIRVYFRSVIFPTGICCFHNSEPPLLIRLIYSLVKDFERPVA